MSSITGLRLSDSDTVAVVLKDVTAGALVFDGLVAREDIPAGHKVALADMATGSAVVKYGQSIGVAALDIPTGGHVHTHNVAMGGPKNLSREARTTVIDPPERFSFEGYRRPNGGVGTRNFIGILATVNCSTTVCRSIADAANARLLPRFPGIDGFAPIIHDQGCGMASSGDGFETLIRTLKGYRDHPNFGGVLLVGLGCEVNQLTLYPPTDWTRDRFASFNVQSTPGSRSAVLRAVELLKPIAERANRSRRVTCPASSLVLGMQCGGSDAFSGLSANPALGVASDLLVAAGGTSLLSETPELFGAETLLTRRADANTAARINTFIAWWQDYVARNGTDLNNNPSPGNKRGGLTTIIEKSLGAVAKAGHSRLSGAIRYAEPVSAPGLLFMDSPGYDPVAATGQIASGANLIAFTTGRGSCFGAKPVPSLKLASTSRLYQAMNEDMDLDCGTVFHGRATIPELGTAIYNRLLDLASGEPSKSELNGYGDLEFVPWKIGAVL